MPQLASAAIIHGLLLSSLRWAYQAKVIKTLLHTSSRIEVSTGRMAYLSFSTGRSGGDKRQLLRDIADFRSCQLPFPAQPFFNGGDHHPGNILAVAVSIPSRPGDELTSRSSGPFLERMISTPAKRNPRIFAAVVASFRSVGVILTTLAEPP